MSGLVENLEAADRVRALNPAQRRFLVLHAFHDPHRWAWKDQEGRGEGGWPIYRRLQANSATRQASITRADLTAIDDCWEDGRFPVVRADIAAALNLNETRND